LCLALIVLMAGCASVVFSEQPLGERIAVFKPEEWNGIWVGNDGSFDRILITDAQNGMLAWGFKEKLCDPAPATKPDQFRQSGSWYFLAARNSQVDARYQISAAFFRDRNALSLYSIDTARVREMVKQGRVPGYLDGEHVVLGQLEPTHYELLLSEKEPAFAWKPTFVLTKLPEELDPCRPRDPSK
jgi:hypothetical protein